MATRKLLSDLRRRPLRILYHSPSHSLHSHPDTNPSSSPNPPNPNPNFNFSSNLYKNSLSPFIFSLNRSISTLPDHDTDSDYGFDAGDESPPEIWKSEAGVGGGGEEFVGGVVSGGGDDPIFPVGALISVLDGVHDLTGLPWWIVIASSTLALRLMLLPLFVLQQNKLKRIGDLLPKLLPPLQPPLSGRSLTDKISHFCKEKKAIGCPSFLWFFAYFSVQVPCFLLWMTSVRRMSLDHHPGFDCGGALWFQDLTEFSHGLVGPIFPLLIAGLHLANVRISFVTSSVGKVAGPLGLLAKYYKAYLELMTLPLLFIGFCIPQGSQVYWVASSSLTAIQQLSFQHPVIREKLGLPDNRAPKVTAIPIEMVTSGPESIEKTAKQHQITAQNLSPKELLALSIKYLAEGHKDRAIPLLQLALDKDPEYVRALTVMGQTLLQDERLEEATDYLERAISKLVLVGHPTEVEEVDLLILASQWAGVAFLRQGKKEEAFVHFERITGMREPDEPKCKAHYYDAFLLVSSALYNEGRKAEAAKYLRLAAAYNPAYKEFLEQCENDDDNLVSDLVSSRRADF